MADGDRQGGIEVRLGRVLIRRSRRNVRFSRRSQRSTQHFILVGKDGVCGDKSKISSRFHGGRENGVVGSLAAGESLNAIGRAFGKPSSSIYFQVAPHGGIRPAPRRRSRLALTLSEREEISRGIAAHRSARSMARLLGHSPSTVSREISRNGGYDRYRAALADEKAWDRARRPKRCKLANSPRLRQAVARKLRLNWSPEQIGGWLKRAHPEDEFAACHTRRSIAAYLFKPAGCLRKSCLAIFDRSGRSADLSRRTRMAIDGGKSRISSQSVSDRQQLKIGRCLVTGKAISCPGRTTATSRPWSNVIRVT